MTSPDFSPFLHQPSGKIVETSTFAQVLTWYPLFIILKGVIPMKKILLFLFLFIIVAGSLTGCQQQTDKDIKAQIQSVPNKDYRGNAHPTVKEDMKLTEEEKADFKELQQEIMADQEGK